MKQDIHTTGQYDARSVRRYERIFGEDFLSTGGIETTRTLCATLGLAPGMRVLDVGSGLGGSAFHLRREHGVQVTGVDLLPQLVAEARRRAAAHGLDNVHFVEGDIMTVPLPEGGFDLVYSRDALLYLEDKAALFRRLHGLLAPGGRLFVTDYACGEGAAGPDFQAYADAAGYHLVSVPAYAAALRAGGFAGAEGEDRTGDFVEILRAEIARVRSLPDDPETGLEAADRDYLVNRWETKIGWCRRGDMVWGHFRAHRAA